MHCFEIRVTAPAGHDNAGERVQDSKPMYVYLQRYKDVPVPSVEHNLPQRLAVVGDLRLDLSGRSPKKAEKITPT